MRSMRSMRGGFICRSRGPLQKVCHGPARMAQNAARHYHCAVPDHRLGDESLGLFVHIPSGCVAKINIP
jgi:hypothetical protein